VSGKDLGLANAVKGHAFLSRHNYDEAIAAFDAAHTADPDVAGYINGRGMAYEAKGDDVWTSTRREQQPFTYGSPPGRDDFYFAGK
jgi:Flp pilus assembly protein TadD